MTDIPLILLIGLPGSGKSTWAAQFVAQRPGYRWVSTDDIRQRLYGDAAEQGDWLQIWQAVVQDWQTSADAVAQGLLQGVVYDATNVRRRYRRSAIAIARQCGFTHLTAHWFDLPLEVCLQRNRQRSRQVPEEIVLRMHRQLMGAPPTLAEGFDQLVRLGLEDPATNPACLAPTTRCQ
jgi:predicted kinase